MSAIVTGLAAFLLVSTVSVAAGATKEQTAELYQLIERGELGAAGKRASNLLEQHPGDAELLFAEALIADKSGRADQAVTLYRNLTVSHPYLLEPYNNLAIHQASSGDYKAAISTLERAMRSNAAVATAYGNLTAIYAQLASAAYRKALNSSTPLAPLSLASLDKLQRPDEQTQSLPTLVASVENFVNQSIADSGRVEAESAQMPIVAEPEPGQVASASGTGGQDSEVNPKPALVPAAPDPAPEPASEPAKEAITEPAAAPEVIPVSAPKPEPEPAPTPKEATPKPVEEVVVAAAKPSEEARRAAEQKANDKQALINHIKSWASAWSDRDVDRYLNHYSDRFVPRNGLALDEWKKQRYGRLRWREFIIVKPSKYRIDLDGDEATVNFSQYYKSDRFEDTIRKTLKLKKEGDRWLIVRELI